MSDLSELIERVKAATGPDRELDALIEVEARRLEAYRAGLNDEQRANWKAAKSGVVTDGHTTYYPYVFTASIDAALALVERCLPGKWDAILSEAVQTLWIEHAPKHPMHLLPLAIILALLLALESQP